MCCSHSGEKGTLNMHNYLKSEERVGGVHQGGRRPQDLSTKLGPQVRLRRGLCVYLVEVREQGWRVLGVGDGSAGLCGFMGKMEAAVGVWTREGPTVQEGGGGAEVGALTTELYCVPQ